ncbi:MAG: MoxR family ATPase [Planctomycetota bacterium]|nr:MoxR family ATPase [Planctomycetota bacterium]
MSQVPEFVKYAAEFRKDFEKLADEIGKIIVGNREIIDGVLTSLFVGGHCLLEGVPGLGKTLLIRSLSEALSLNFQRIQFTPDLMPADIVGTNMVVETPDGKREFQFQSGPIFANICLADEINRATPKTQSALLEAMQEKSVTVGGTTHKLTEPFLVMATQNPLEMEGTYPLPEAQLDRFLVKLIVHYASLEELMEILDRTTANVTPHADKVIDAKRILNWRKLVKQVVVAPHVKNFAARLILSTHPEGEYAAPVTNQYVRYGSSPRGAQALILVSKVKALLDERFNISFDDIRAAAAPCLRHRMILNFEGEAEGISTDKVVEEILDSVPQTV